jgi:hypothetical protein
MAGNSQERDMPRQLTSSTHYLFLRIIAAVAEAPRPPTVEELSRELNTSPEIIAQCIALHLYMERKKSEDMVLPPPSDYWVPAADDVITPHDAEAQASGKNARC